MDSKLLKRLEQKKTRLAALLPSPAKMEAQLKRRIMVEWIYNSNAIEGNTLSLRETQFILVTGMAIGKKSLREHLEVINHREAIEYVEMLAQRRQSLIIDQICQIHKILFSKIDDSNAGEYRRTSVRILGAQHIPPRPEKVPYYMDKLTEWLLEAQKELHPVELAIEAHYRFVAIHPFVDGNGRTARLVMNLFLQKHGYPPAIILNAARYQYIQALSDAESGNMGPLTDLIEKAIERTIMLYIKNRDSIDKQSNRNLFDKV